MNIIDELFDPYKVYVQVDAACRVVAINSNAFLSDVEDWRKIDEGYGDKFHHAQNNYLPEPITDERGIYRYKLEDGEVVERTVEEMDADYVPPEPSTPNDLEARMIAMEQLLASYEAAYAQGVQDA